MTDITAAMLVRQTETTHDNEAMALRRKNRRVLFGLELYSQHRHDPEITTLNDDETNEQK